MSDEKIIQDKEYWVKTAAILEREFVLESDLERRANIRRNIFKIQSDFLGQDSKSTVDLSTLLEGDKSVDVVWEAWRAATGMDAPALITALERIAHMLPTADDRASCHMEIARRFSEGSHAHLKRAQDEDPKHRGALWHELSTALQSGDDDQMLDSLERMISKTNDPVLQSVMLLERLSILRSKEADLSDLENILRTVLKLKEAYWLSVNDVLRISSELKLWSVHCEALEHLGLTSLEQHPTPVENMPEGFSFQGFIRGTDEAAAWLWMAAITAEYRLREISRALGYIEHAAQLLPSSGFLRREQARLLQAVGQFDLAADHLRPEDCPAWRAEIALARQLPEDALSILNEDNVETTSIYVSALMREARLKSGVPDDPPDDVNDLDRWLQENPHHSSALSIAEQLLQQGVDSNVASLIADEGRNLDGPWPTEKDQQVESSWSLALEALLGDTGGSLASFLAWHEKTEFTSLKYVTLMLAAQSAEIDGDNDRALELATTAREYTNDFTESNLLKVRLLRSSEKWKELAALLKSLSSAREPAVSRASLRESSRINEYILNDLAAASDDLCTLTDQGDDDLHTVWSQLRVACRQEDWTEVVSHLDSLAKMSQKLTSRMNLLSGEILLLILGRREDAIERFRSAEETLDFTLAHAAVIYRLMANRQRNDPASLDDDMEKLLEVDHTALENILWAEMIQATFFARGSRAAKDLLERSMIPRELEIVWGVLLSSVAGGMKSSAKSFGDLWSVGATGRAAGACRTAQLLLQKDQNSVLENFRDSDVESPEALWHVADRLEHSADPSIRADLFERRAKISLDTDLSEWADWCLCHAEALEDQGLASDALSIIREGLEKISDHPGLLEACARIARLAESWEEAADIHRRLAKYYLSQDEKAVQLTYAATILFEKTKDVPGAKRAALEAVRRAPNHDAAHHILTEILKAENDTAALFKQVENRIPLIEDLDLRLALYVDHIDRLYEMNDADRALAAIAKLHALQPDHLSTHRKRVDILISLERWAEAVSAMFELKQVVEDQIERRTIVWRAADILDEKLNDREAAITALTTMIEEGDNHPQTERQIGTLAKKAGEWEIAAESLERLIERISDKNKKAELLKEFAVMSLEHLFDPDVAAEAMNKLLDLMPGDVDSLLFLLSFTQRVDSLDRIAKAELITRREVFDNPLSVDNINRLMSVNKVLMDVDEQETDAMCKQTVALLKGDSVFAGTDDVETLRENAEPLNDYRKLVHPSEWEHPAGVILKMAMPATAAAFAKDRRFPKTGRGTLILPKHNDAVRLWLERWAHFIGINEFALHRIGEDSRGSMPLPAELPALAINDNRKEIAKTKDRFFLSRHLWWSSRGMGAFSEGDTVGPLRWVLALASAVLGDKAKLPFPTDRDLVIAASKALSRKLKKQLIDPCEALMKCDPQDIRDWINGVSYSADRVGLLSAGDLSGVISLIVMETADDLGLRQYAESPVNTLEKIPRAQELIKFAFDRGYYELRKVAGISKGGADE